MMIPSEDSKKPLAELKFNISESSMMQRDSILRSSTNVEPRGLLKLHEASKQSFLRTLGYNLFLVSLKGWLKSAVVFGVVKLEQMTALIASLIYFLAVLN